MGIMVYSLLWVMQDLYHQPYLGVKGSSASASHCIQGWAATVARSARAAGFTTSLRSALPGRDGLGIQRTEGPACSWEASCSTSP